MKPLGILWLLGGLVFGAGVPAHSGTARVKLGNEVLAAHKFKELAGKRVGLITNPSGVNGKLESTIDVLHAAPGDAGREDRCRDCGGLEPRRGEIPRAAGKTSVVLRPAPPGPQKL